MKYAFLFNLYTSHLTGGKKSHLGIAGTDLQSQIFRKLSQKDLSSRPAWDTD